MSKDPHVMTICLQPVTFFTERHTTGMRKTVLTAQGGRNNVSVQGMFAFESFSCNFLIEKVKRMVILILHFMCNNLFIFFSFLHSVIDFTLKNI